MVQGGNKKSQPPRPVKITKTVQPQVDPEPGSSAQTPVKFTSSLLIGLMQDGNVPLVFDRV